jgi:hypothetical protein
MIYNSQKIMVMLKMILVIVVFIISLGIVDQSIINDSISSISSQFTLSNSLYPIVDEIQCYYCDP